MSASDNQSPATRMFAMHERTRLFVCRAGFVLACLLPTILTVSAISYFRSDAYMTARREEWVATFSQRLGMKVEIDELSYPNLSTALLKGVRLRDSETEALVCEAYHVEVTKHDDGTWELEFDLPTLMTECLPALQQRLHDRVFAELPKSFPQVQCHAKRMPLVGKTQVTLNDVELNFFVSDEGPAAECYFRIYGVDMKQPILAKMCRHRAGGVARSEWEFSTQESEIPCDVLAIFAPKLSVLGDRARMNGSAKGSIGRQEDSLTFVGTMRDASLENLTDGRVPLTPKLGKSREKWLARGLASIEVRNLRFIDGHVTACDASLTATQRGSLGSELVDAAVKHFSLQGPSNGNAQTTRKLKPTTLGFAELAFDIALADSKLQLTGRVDQKPHRNGVIASNMQGEALLVETEPKWIPQIALVQFIAPPSDQSIPANPEAVRLMDSFGPPRRLLNPPGRTLQTERPMEENLK